MNDAHPQMFGRYRLTSLLGEGGMGKVYRGFDSTLERNVAIKLLPPHLVSDSVRLSRFVQEARSAGSLNHPNIVTVYDIGEERLEGQADRVHYIAMELIDGRTLREWIIGNTDLRKGLKLAVQVAEGLAAAHAAGVIHRDLKPENIMVTSSGYVKVLDFGLAKLHAREDDGSIETSRTIAKGSEPGTVMGTVGYMAPEQAQGRAVDARADVFSFGCILYEIASGRRAFQGDSSVDTLHKIIHDDPPALREIREGIPTELARIVRRALAKDPDERYQSMKDVAIDLRELLREIESGSATTLSSPILPRVDGKRRSILVPALVGLVLIAGTIGFFALRHRQTAPIATQSMRITRVTANGKVIDAALSPDGRYTAYVVSDQGQHALMIKDMSSGQSLTLVPPKRTAYWGLTFTPDGSSIYYGVKWIPDASGWIYQISPLGGQPRKIIQSIDSHPAFSPDGKRMVFLRAEFPTKAESALMICNSDGTNLRTLLTVHAPDYLVPIFFAGASWSPDGSMIATAVIRREILSGGRSTKVSARIVTVGVADSAVKTICDRGWTFIGQVAWLPDQKGLIAIANDGGQSSTSQVWHVPYPSGEPEPVTRDLFDYRTVTLSADGKSLLTVASDRSSDVWIARDGQTRRINASKSEGMYGMASLPDGRIVTTSLETGKLDLFVMNEDGSGRTQLTRVENVNRSPAAMPDGSGVVFSSTTPKGSEICRINIDGSGRKVLAPTGNQNATLDVSPDGKSVVFDELFSGSGSDALAGEFGVMRVSPDGGAASRMGNEKVGLPVFSPDGTKLAVLLLDQKDVKLYLATVPAAGGTPTKVAPWQGTTYSMVRWMPDGKSLVMNTVENDRSNLWQIPLDGSPRKKLTNFDERSLFSFAPLRDGKGWVLSRGELSRDAVLITGFK